MNIDCDCHDHDIFRKLNPGENKKITFGCCISFISTCWLCHTTCLLCENNFFKNFFQKKNSCDATDSTFFLYLQFYYVIYLD